MDNPESISGNAVAISTGFDAYSLRSSSVRTRVRVILCRTALLLLHLGHENRVNPRRFRYLRNIGEDQLTFVMITCRVLTAIRPGDLQFPVIVSAKRTKYVKEGTNAQPQGPSAG